MDPISGRIALLAVLVGAISFAIPAKSHDLIGPVHDGAMQQSTAHQHVADTHGGVAPPTGVSDPPETTFYTDVNQVNTRMHEAMNVAPTGDPDRDFARMMIPHHQGAIEMALVLLKNGHDKRLRRLAESIIVEQREEIAYMRLLLGAQPAEPPAINHPAH